MSLVYVFARDPDSDDWIVSRVGPTGREPLFTCPTAPEAHALTRALRSLAKGDKAAHCDAIRELGLRSPPTQETETG